MSKAGASFSEIEKRLMEDEKFKEEYEKAKPRYELVSSIIRARIEQNLTQEELALRVGTRKSNISRLESGNYNPSLDFANKIAKGLGKELYIELR
ncbi:MULTISPECIES: helix-turn-helix transcriptional regulator [Clostridium]|uniref:helix-turn-helix transcriptional regulator n=1 Tax=Clostridium TaxID=1485 RepID=UPI000824DF06|nr:MULTISPECIES: helix-turn-helix transcriptional regulator [Clostridium]PJI10221.1 XRE family transcriptional regulator [Clostridium sp. CT7]